MKQREKILLLSFLAIVFLITNGWAVSWLLTQYQDLKIQNLDLQEEEIALQRLMKEEQLYQRRREWLNKFQPTVAQDENRGIQLLNIVTEASQNDALTIVKNPAFQDTLKDRYYTLERIDVSAKGDTENLIRWALQFEKPTEFLNILSLNLISNPQKEEITCRLEIGRWYHPELSPEPALKATEKNPTETPQNVSNVNIPEKSESSEN